MNSFSVIIKIIFTTFFLIIVHKIKLIIKSSIRLFHLSTYLTIQLHAKLWLTFYDMIQLQIVSIEISTFFTNYTFSGT